MCRGWARWKVTPLPVGGTHRCHSWQGKADRRGTSAWFGKFMPCRVKHQLHDHRKACVLPRLRARTWCTFCVWRAEAAVPEELPGTAPGPCHCHRRLSGSCREMQDTCSGAGELCCSRCRVNNGWLFPAQLQHSVITSTLKVNIEVYCRIPGTQSISESYQQSQVIRSKCSFYGLLLRWQLIWWMQRKKLKQVILWKQRQCSWVHVFLLRWQLRFSSSIGNVLVWFLWGFAFRKGKLSLLHYLRCLSETKFCWEWTKQYEIWGGPV